MATQIRLGSSQLSELKVIRDLPPASVAAVVDRLDRSEPPPLTTVELAALFDEEFGRESGAGESMLKQVLSLASLERHRDLTPDDVLGGLRYGVRSSSHPWTEEEFDRWFAVEPELRRLLEHPKIWRVAKALDLSYDFAHLLQDVRIVSDIRPVFDREATQLEAAVVSFTLRLQYESISGSHGISIAMNRKDVESLLDECQRALRKARLASELMNERAKVRTTISGDDNREVENDVTR